MLAVPAEEFDPNPSRAVRRRPPAEFVPLLEEIVADVRPESLGAQLSVMAEADERDLLPGIAVSTLLVWAELDVRSSLDVARQFEAALTDTDLVVIPGPGHLSNLERPDAFNEAVREFCHAHQPSDVNVVGSSHVAIPGYGADGPQRRRQCG